MAYEVLQDIADNLDYLIAHDVRDLPALVPLANAFLNFALDEKTRRDRNRRTYSIRIEDVDRHASALLQAIADAYKGRDAPRSLGDFMEHVAKMLDEEAVSIYSCKRPLSDLGIDFEDIAGLRDEKDQLRSAYIFPFRFMGLYRKLSRGILLYGPPGTGKTLLAKAATKELKNAAFFSATAGDLKSKYACAERVFTPRSHRVHTDSWERHRKECTACSRVRQNTRRARRTDSISPFSSWTSSNRWAAIETRAISMQPRR